MFRSVLVVSFFKINPSWVDMLFSNAVKWATVCLFKCQIRNTNTEQHTIFKDWNDTEMDVYEHFNHSVLTKKD